MKVVIAIVLLVVALVVLIAIIGILLPREHTASSRIRLKKSRADIWKTLADREASRSWRSDLASVERLPDHDGHEVWRETGKFGVLTLEVMESLEPARIVTRIADPNLPFGGRWIYEIAPEGDETTVTITEEGEIKNPFFRFMARFLFGYHATQESYLRALAARFGENATPERVR